MGGGGEAGCGVGLGGGGWLVVENGEGGAGCGEWTGWGGGEAGCGVGLGGGGRGFWRRDGLEGAVDDLGMSLFLGLSVRRR
jgi:hypothetical protein